MRVTVLGSAAMFATTDRAASGYLIQLDGANVWLDAGAGTWRNLLSAIDYSDLDAIVLTHHHPDHVSDVFQAYHARMFGQSEPLDPIPLLAPEETIARCLGFAEGMGDSFDLRKVSAGDEVDLAGGRFSFHDMAHPPETLGVRIESGGSTFAYSADTGPGADFSDLIADADLFICEATFQNADPEWEGHLHSSAAAELANRYRVRRLVLTHLPPRRDVERSLTEARDRAGDMIVELATDGKVYEL